MDQFLKRGIAVFILLMISNACYDQEELNVPVKTNPDVSNTELDQYISNNFIEKYDMAIRYRFVDRYVDPDERVTPPKLEVVRPMLDFIEEYWIDPYLEVENGEDFFKLHVPAEVIFLGGLIYNEDGTVTLGTADAGARITFTDVNSIDPQDTVWRATQLQTVYHEFAHIVHQKYKLPPSFENISPLGYTSPGSWFTLTDEEAVDRGFVSPYATSSPNEDFAETVAFFLFDKNFHENFIEIDSDCNDPACEQDNEGKQMILEKLNAITEHYQKVTDVDLEALRTIIQSKL